MIVGTSTSEVGVVYVGITSHLRTCILSTVGAYAYAYQLRGAVPGASPFSLKGIGFRYLINSRNTPQEAC